MAVNNLSSYTNDSGFALPLNIRRTNPNPLDNTSVWGSLSAAENYAKNNPTAYVGQLLVVLESDKVGAYVIINESGDLVLLGGSEIKITDVQQKVEETSTKVDTVKTEQEQIKQEQTQIKTEQTTIKQEQAQMKQEQTDIKSEQTQIKQETTNIKNEQTTIKQEQTNIKQEQTQIKQEQESIKQEQTQIKNDIETEITQKVEDIRQEIEQSNTTVKTEIKTEIGEITNPDTGETNLPEEATDIVDAINKVNDKIVDPREDEEQWATKEDIDNLYGNLFDDLGW